VQNAPPFDILEVLAKPAQDFFPLAFALERDRRPNSVRIFFSELARALS